MPINPWSRLPAHAPYVLPEDQPAIDHFNATARSEHRLHLELLPEPFLGTPTAPVVLLSLNPGYSPEDLAAHQDSGFQARSRANLTHAASADPFLLLNPEIQAPGRRWWEAKLAPLIKACGREAVAAGVMCIEYFAYHSLRFAHGELRVPSQDYAFQLLRVALQRQALIVALRAERLWRAAVPELASYAFLYRLNSAQNVVVSERNCPAGYAAVVRALSGSGRAVR